MPSKIAQKVAENFAGSPNMEEQTDPGQEKKGKDEQDKDQQRRVIKYLKHAERVNFVSSLTTMAGRMLKFLGVEFTIAAVLRQSQVSTNFISHIFRLLGIVADTLLLPFLPLLGPLAKFITTTVVPFIQDTLKPKIERIADFMGGVLNFLFDLFAAWGPFFEGIFEGIATLTEWVTGIFQAINKWGENMSNILIGLVTGMIIMRKLFVIFRGLYQKWKGIESAQMERGFTGIQARQDITNALLKNQLALSQGQAAGAIPGLPGGGAIGRLGKTLGFAGGALPIALGGALAATLVGLLTTPKPDDSSIPKIGSIGGRGKDLDAEITLSFINQGGGERYFQVEDVLSRNDKTRFAISVGDA